MRILVDTNVVLDILLSRQSFVDDAVKALEKASMQGDRLFFSSSSVTDVYYLVRKQTGSRETALNAVNRMSEFLLFADVNERCILSATMSKLNDFEDAVVEAVALNVKADIILSRNISDFQGSCIRAISPTEYLDDAVIIR